MKAGRQEQIEFCLNCTRPECNGNECKGLKDYTAGIHRMAPEDIDRLIIRFLPYCDTWTALSEVVKCNKTTLRQHAIALGLDISKFRKGKNGRQKSQAPQGAGYLRQN